MSWYLIKRSVETQQEIEKFEVSETKVDLLRDLGLEKIERNLRNGLRDDKFVSPQGKSEYEYKWSDIDGDIIDIFIAKEDHSISFQCDHCGISTNIVHSFRGANLCDGCYNDNDMLMQVMNATYKNNVSLYDYTNIKNKNILIIPDLHAPFVINEYLDFCKMIYEKYNCDFVIFLGDLIDNHFGSYHDTDPDGLGGAKELELAKEQIHQYYEVFPNSLVCIGNHDAIPYRKGFSGGVSKSWMKPINEVLDTPNWIYKDNFIIDGVLYNHGIGGEAKTKLRNNLTSTVGGHYHGKSYIEYKIDQNNKKYFAMQLGVGCDQDKYAFAYAKHFSKFHVNIGVILNDGKIPIVEYLGDYYE